MPPRKESKQATLTNSSKKYSLPSHQEIVDVDAVLSLSETESIPPLDAGDSMYRGRKPSRIKKHTDLVKGRVAASSVCDSASRPTRKNLSPVKKSRDVISEDEEDDDEPIAWAPSPDPDAPVTPTPDLKGKAKRIRDSPSPDPFRSHGSRGTHRRALSPRKRSKVGAVVHLGPSLLKSVDGTTNFEEPLYLPSPEDTLCFRTMSLPSECAVTARELQDDLLADTYVGAPNLRSCEFISWSVNNPDLEFDGVEFSSWTLYIPDINMDYLVRIAGFKSHGRFIGPGRFSPKLIYGVWNGYDQKQATLHYNGTVAVCLTLISVTASYVHSFAPENISKFRPKLIAGDLHHQEFQRLQGFMGTVFNQEKLIINPVRRSLSFQTMGSVSGHSPGTSASPVKVVYPRLVSPIRARVASLSTKVKHPDFSTPYHYNKALLGPTDRIVVYDARKVDFCVVEDFDRLFTLPQYVDEILIGALVLVGYTAGISLSRSGENESEARYGLNFNIQFAVLLGIPIQVPDDMES